MQSEHLDHIAIERFEGYALAVTISLRIAVLCWIPALLVRWAALAGLLDENSGITLVDWATSFRGAILLADLTLVGGIIVSGICFLVWFKAAYRLAAYATTNPPTSTPSKALWSFFKMPQLLYMPHQLMVEIWQRLYVEWSRQPKLKASSKWSTNLIDAWWIGYIFSVMTIPTVREIGTAAGAPESSPLILIWDILAATWGIASFVVTLRMVNRTMYLFRPVLRLLADEKKVHHSDTVMS